MPGRPSPTLPKAVRREFYLALARTTSLTVALALTYSLAPMSDPVHDGLPLLAGSLLLLTGLMVWHVRAVSRSAYPGVRAMEALASSIPFLLLCFSAFYYMEQLNTPQSFASTLTRLDALYFTVTVFATVGFGDITAHSELARAVVTGQMILDFLFIGIVVRVLLGAVKLSRGEAGPVED